jgi:hypothetical protein
MIRLDENRCAICGRFCKETEWACEKCASKDQALMVKAWKLHEKKRKVSG